MKGISPSTVAALALLAAVALPAPAHATDATVALDVDACAEVPELAVRNIVSIEIGDLLAPRGGEPPAGGYRLVARCTAGAAHLEARPVDGPDGLERTLRLDDFPGDAAPRALALAGIEMLAALDPAVRARVEARPPAAAPEEDAAGLSLSLAGVYRAFLGTAGAAGWGGRVGLDGRRGLGLIAADVEVDDASSATGFGETHAWVGSLGAFGGGAVAGTRFGCALAAGARAGLVWLSGDPAALSGLRGQSVTRPWWGPAIAARLHAGGARVAAVLTLEGGWVVHGAQGLAGGSPAIAIEGGWLMAGAGVKF